VESVKQEVGLDDIGTYSNNQFMKEDDNQVQSTDGIFIYFNPRPFQQIFSYILQICIRLIVMLIIRT